LQELTKCGESTRAKIPVPVDPAHFDGRSVLVIDDSPDRIAHIDHILARLGITNVRHARNLRATTEILADVDASIDFVVQGLRMADADRVALRQALATRRAQPHVILLAADGEVPEVLAAGTVSHFAHQAAAPLMIVMMLTEMLLESNALTPAQADDVRRIEHAVGELRRMINELRSK
jgi:DNA-binding NtrC family response regulator